MSLPVLKKYLLITAGVIALAYTVTIFFYVPQQPYLGFYVFGDRKIEKILSSSDAILRNFKKGDVVIKIGERRLNNYTDYIRVMAELHPVRETTVQVERRGVPMEAVEISVRHTPVPYDALLWCLVGLPIFGFGFYIYSKKSWERPVRLFCLLCVVTTCTFVGGLQWMSIVGNALLLSILVVSLTMLMPVSLHFFLTFPEPKKFFLSFRPLKYLLYAGPLVIFLLMEACLWGSSFPSVPAYMTRVSSGPSGSFPHSRS